jgi:hypothetical protein
MVMTTIQMVEKVSLLFDGHEVELIEKDLAAFSEMYFGALIQKDIVKSPMVGQRIYKGKIIPESFKLLRQDEFIEDLIFLAAMVKDKFSRKELAHFLNFLIKPKIQYFSLSKKHEFLTLIDIRCSVLDTVYLG